MMPSSDEPLQTVDPAPGDDASAAGQPSPGASPETATFQPTAGGATPHARAASRVPPPVIPGYEIIRVLGRGGMGVVYQARHLALKRTVALKMVLAGGHAGPAELARFRIEAEAVARLQHPNIVQIHEVGEADGHPYFALEYLEGGSLAQRLRGQPLAPREAACLVEALARAMQLAHSRNVIHRDLKPANVLLAADGAPKVSDFGLARQLDEDSGQTQAGVVVGTPSYMAPEQAAGAAHAAGPAADVYALGAILYECLTGRPPHRGTTTIETLEAVRTREPEPPRRLRPKLPRDLETVCLKCLRKEPERRYASAEALAEDLRRWAAGEPIAARPVGSLERTALWVRRKPAWAGLVLMLALLIVAVVTFSSLLAYREHQAADNLLRTQGEREAALTRARQEMARVALDRGLNLCEAGDVGLGLLHLIRALDSAVQAPDADLESAIRFNIAAWETQLWSLRNYWELPPTTKVLALALSPHGSPLAVVLPNNTVELWDIKGGHTAEKLHSLPHDEAIRAYVTFSRDGSRLLTLSGRTVYIWDVATGRQAGPPLVHPHSVYGAGLSRDGKWVLTGAGNPQVAADNVKEATARLWQADTGTCVASRPHKRCIRIVAFSPRGDRALSGDDLGVVQLWKLPGGETVGVPLVHKQGIKNAVFSPDGTRVLTATSDNTVHLWHAVAAKPVFAPLSLDDRAITALAFSPDGQRFAVLTPSKGQVHLWRADTGDPIASPLPLLGLAYSMAFSPDSRTLLTGGAGLARGWDAMRGLPTGPLLAHQGVVSDCIFSSDGRSIVTWDGAVHWWDAPSGLRRGPTLEHQARVGALAFSPDGRLLLTGSFDLSGSKHAVARLWDTGPAAAAPRGAPPRLLNQDLPRVNVGVMAVAFSPDGRLALTGGFDNEPSLWDVAGGVRRARFKGHRSAVYAIAFSHNGKTALSGGADGTARLWDVATAEPLAVLPHPGIVKAVAFSPDDRHALTGSTGKTAVLWDLSTQPPVGKSLAHEGLVDAVAFSLDGGTAITADFTADLNGGSIHLWDTATGTLLRTLQGHVKGIQSLAVSQDGKYLISGSWDRTARLWKLSTGEAVGVPLQHQAVVRDAAFSQDGRTVYTGSEDNTARRWHVPTGLPIGPAIVHGHKVRVVAVHPNSTMFATGSWDNTAALWEAPGPKDGSPAQLARWAERVTGIRLDESGALRVLTATAWQALTRER